MNRTSSISLLITIVSLLPFSVKAMGEELAKPEGKPQVHVSLLSSQLTPIPADSVVMEDFFWTKLISAMKKSGATPRNLDLSLSAKDRKLFEHHLKLWTLRKDSLTITGGTSSEEGSCDAQAASAAKTATDAFRLFLLTGNGGFASTMERALYNGVCAGLFAKEQHTRQNSENLVNSIGGLIYATSGKNLYINQYIQGNAHVKTKQMDLKIRQDNNMPWFSTSIFTLYLEKPQKIKLFLHIPHWLQENTDDKYKRQSIRKKISLMLNDLPVKTTTQGDYWVIDRVWNDSDRVSIVANMPIARVFAPTENLVAIERGPFVYSFLNPCSNYSFDVGAPIKVDYDKEYYHAEILSGELTEKNSKAYNFKSVPYFLGWKDDKTPNVWIEKK